MNGKSSNDRRNLLHSISTGGNPKYADADLLKKVFGKDPNYNLMRALIVGDSHSKDADLMLIESRVLSQDYKGWHWKPVGRDNSSPPMRVWCESLRPGCQSEVTISLDDFLLNDYQAMTELNFPNRIETDFAKLMTDVNKYSRQMLDSEILYFEKRNDEKSELSQILRSIETVRKHIPAGNNSMVIRLGWGSGWQSMTGDYIDDASLMQSIRQGFHLGRPGMPFPKSRKIAFSNNQPTFPFGWIKLEALK
jgi:CRISPR-associated protein Csm5